MWCVPGVNTSHQPVGAAGEDENALGNYRRLAGMSTRRHCGKGFLQPHSPWQAPVARERFHDRDDRRARNSPARPLGSEQVSDGSGAAGRDIKPGLPGFPSESVRGAATVLLALYLLGMVLCIAGNSASGSSALVETLQSRLFSPWMVPLWLDLGFDNRLTYGLPEDADHSLAVAPAAGGEGRRMRFPEALDRSERGARWRRLARAVVFAEDDADRAGVLPAAIAAGLFAKLGSEDLTVKVVRVVPAEFSAAATPAVEETPFEARIRRVDGAVQIIPVKPAGEVAPLVERK